MASRFDSWVSTAPVHLPIETYKVAALVNEQKTQQALDNIGQTMAAYNNITPFGSNATAVYEDAMNRLRSQVDEVTKMELDTPTAKRRINQVISDRGITRDLKNVMVDSMYAGQRQKELQEYLKKNPSVNATEYFKAFNDVNYETGNPGEFNPNRFKNMNPLVDYVDVNKMIGEGVDKLKQNKQKVKEILGDYYYEWERNGLHEDRIRKHVANQLATNPLVSEQVNRSMENAIYRADPRDRNKGVQKLAMGYRIGANDELAGNIAQYQAMIKQRSEQITKGAKKGVDSKKLLNSDPELTRMKRLLMESENMRGAYTDPTHPAFKDDEEQVRNGYLNSFVNGFSEMAYSDTVDMYSFNEMAIAKYKAAADMARLKYKLKKQEEMLKPVITEPLTYSLPLTQDSVQGQTMRDVIARTPGLEDVSKYIDDHGAVDFTKPSSLVPGKLGIKTASELAEAKKSIKYGSFDDFQSGKNVAPAGQYTPEQTKNEIVAKLNTFLKDHGLNAESYNGFKDETDVRKGFQDIMRFQQANEKIYNQTYTIAQSNSDAMRKTFIEAGSLGGLYDDSGKPVDAATMAVVAQTIRDKKLTVSVTPALKGVKTNQSFWTVATPDGKVYHAGMDDQNSLAMTAPRNSVLHALNDRKGYLANPDLSANIVEMKPGGEAVGMNIPFVMTKEYQEAASEYWNDNEAKLIKLGYNKNQAKDLLNANYDDVQKQIIINNPTGKENKGGILKTPKGNIEILVPIKARGDIFYSQFSMFDGQFSKRGITDLATFNRKGVLSFSNVDDNPGIYQISEDDIRAKTREAVRLFDDDEDD